MIHTLRALVHSMREASELAGRTDAPHSRHLAVPFSEAQQSIFVKLVTPVLEVKPLLPTLLGLELALEARLDEINGGLEVGGFRIQAFPSKVSAVISAFNGLASCDERRWAFLFDELEIALASVKSFLFSAIRSFDQRVVIKLALAPYMDDVLMERNPGSPQPLHDYDVVQLSYPSKEDAFRFSTELFENTFRRMGVNFNSLHSLLNLPGQRSQFGRRPEGAAQRRGIPPVFRSLFEKDELFRNYVGERGIFQSDYVLTEQNLARDVRKVLPIVVARDHYLRKYEGQHAVVARSRKSFSLYSGYPAIVEITDGNPRAVLTLVGPMAQEILQDGGSAGPRYGIPFALQSQAVRRVELLLTSLLQVIPLDVGGFDSTKGLLDFIDHIGRALEDRLLRGAFRPDYVGTFFLDENVTPGILSAVGKALNAGGLVHVPHPDGGPGGLLRGLQGQRFRISYSLAPRYRLLLTLGDSNSLSRLLLEMRGVDVGLRQTSLLEGA